ncbi:MAG: SPOR domain-containing protein [Mariprofundus sp.]|nr:SPOR domain-containing protein [Mariprofundus sp.]
MSTEQQQNEQRNEGSNCSLNHLDDFNTEPIAHQEPTIGQQHNPSPDPLPDPHHATESPTNNVPRKEGKAAKKRPSLPTILVCTTLLFVLLITVISLNSRTTNEPANQTADNQRIQNLEHRLSTLEQLRQATNPMQSQLTQLEENVAALTTKLQALASSQHRNTEQSHTKAAPPPPSPKHSIVKKDQTLQTAWVINIASLKSLSQATTEQARLLQHGIKTAVSEITIKHKTWYRIHSRSFSTKEEAIAYNKEITNRFSMKGSWLQKL